MAASDPTPFAPTPGRVGRSDPARVESVTAALRAKDYRNGGGSCHDDALAELNSVRPLLAARATDPVARRLTVAVADLHGLVGWACFDIGRVRPAMAHFRQALRLARDGGDDALLAGIHYRIGRVRLHHNALAEALAQFQRGDEVARRSGSDRAVAIMCANQAWAYAKMGLAADSTASLRRAGTAFDAAEGTEPPRWAAFFDATDFSAITGVIHTELAALVDVSHTRLALPALTAAVDGFGDAMARSRAFCLISLAVSHLLDGDVDQAVAVAGRVLGAAQGL
ncbi:tetratricopeptide repeat protein [Solihabitans fulvus]|uniref:Tetratricopeptide repeat protein n=1 Tax=Solihabitans fulvus TaxID=1892852 RepID=A0A5B2XE09_9PSEU|nr:tetratricopeptide repeat protein [Solihabitans fulvus]KAA2261384.1 tetratricopeptide repeat protein [Solihabitans fulvus]